MSVARSVLGVGFLLLAVIAVLSLRPESADAPTESSESSDSGAESSIASNAEGSVPENASVASSTENHTEVASDEQSREVVTGDATIQGIVRFEDGRPAPGATIIARSLIQVRPSLGFGNFPSVTRGLLPQPPLDMSDIRATSGTDGRFVLAGGARGAWTLACELDGFLWKRSRGVIARPGVPVTIDLVRATRVEIEIINADGSESGIETVSFVFLGEDDSIESTWNRERPVVWLPPGDHLIETRVVATPSSKSFGLSTLRVEPSRLRVGEQPQRLVLRVNRQRDLTVRIKPDPRFAMVSEFYVTVGPYKDSGSRSDDDGFQPISSEPISFRRPARFTDLAWDCVVVRLESPNTPETLAEKLVDRRSEPGDVVFELSKADFGDEIDVDFRSARSTESEIVQIESCSVKGAAGNEIRIFHARQTDRHQLLFVNRELRRKLLERDPLASVSLDVRHVALGRHRFEVPLAATNHTCVIRAPAELTVRVRRERGQSDFGCVVTLARFERGAWKALTDGLEMTWVDEGKLKPVEPGSYSLLLSLDRELTRILRVQPITLSEGANQVTLTLSPSSRVELKPLGVAEGELRIESSSSGELLQRWPCKAGETILASLSPGDYRAVVRAPLRYGVREFHVPIADPVQIETRVSDRFELSRLDPGGELDSLGLRVGDAWIEIDGRAFSQISVTEWVELQYSDRKTACVFERGGNRIEVKLIPHRWLDAFAPSSEFFMAPRQ